MHVGPMRACAPGTARMESSRRQRHPCGVPLPGLTRSLAPMPYDSKKPTITAMAKIHVYCEQTGWAGGVERISRPRSTFDAAAAVAAASRMCGLAAGVWLLLHPPARCSGGWQGQCLHQAAAGAAGRRACTRAARPPRRRLEGGSHQLGGGALRAERPASPTHRAEHHGAPVSSAVGRGSEQGLGEGLGVWEGATQKQRTVAQALQAANFGGMVVGRLGGITFMWRESCSHRCPDDGMSPDRCHRRFVEMRCGFGNRSSRENGRGRGAADPACAGALPRRPPHTPHLGPAAPS